MSTPLHRASGDTRLRGTPAKSQPEGRKEKQDSDFTSGAKGVTAMAPHWNHMMAPRNQDTILVEVERHLPSTGKTIGTVLGTVGATVLSCACVH